MFVFQPEPAHRTGKGECPCSFGRSEVFKNSQSTTASSRHHVLPALSPVDQARPPVALGTREEGPLEGLLVCVGVVDPTHLCGLAEQDGVFREEHFPQILSPSTANDECILASQWPLFLQIHLQTEQVSLRDDWIPADTSTLASEKGA